MKHKYIRYEIQGVCMFLLTILFMALCFTSFTNLKLLLNRHTEIYVCIYYGKCQEWKTSFLFFNFSPYSR